MVATQTGATPPASDCMTPTVDDDEAYVPAPSRRSLLHVLGSACGAVIAACLLLAGALASLALLLKAARYCAAAWVG